MRILSRKKLQFKTDAKGSTVIVEPLVFTEVPESAKQDPMYGWALADGTIEVIETIQQQKKLENEPIASNEVTEDDKETEKTSKKK